MNLQTLSVLSVLSCALLSLDAHAQCTTFEPLGSAQLNGANGIIRAVHARQEGTARAVYIGGNFSSVGGNVQARGVARWSGSAWTAVGTPSQFNGEVRSIIEYNAELYIGGQFTVQVGEGQSIRGLAKWNGISWSAVSGQSITGSVDAMAVYNGDLYVGGQGLNIQIPGFPSAQNFARWDGAAWSTTITAQASISGPITAMTVHDDGSGPALFFGGSMIVTGPNGLNAQRIAKFNGAAFSAVGTGIQSGFVYALASLRDASGPALYAGGDFIEAGGVPDVNRIAKWQNGAWSSLGAGVIGGPVRALSVHQGLLIAGGLFNRVDGADMQCIAAWNGSAWSPFGLGAIFGVYAIAPLQDNSGLRLYVAGDFSRLNNALVQRIARGLPTLPTIAPPSRTAAPDDVVSFTVTPAGVGPYSYRWLHNGVPLVEGGRFFGTANSTLFIGPIARAGSDPAWTDAGQYTAVVTSACGESSASVALTVQECTADFNDNGFVDSQDLFDFLAAFFTGCP